MVHQERDVSTSSTCTSCWMELHRSSLVGSAPLLDLCLFMVFLFSSLTLLRYTATESSGEELHIPARTLHPADLVKALLKPRIKVRNEYVQQGRTQSQVTMVTMFVIMIFKVVPGVGVGGVLHIGALSKCLYKRLFCWTVQ